MKMPAEMKAKWIEALRSGKYKQGAHTLFNPDSKAYCCLGVLEQVCDGEIEATEFEEYETCPTPEWYKDHNVLDVTATYSHGDTYSPTFEGMLTMMNDGNNAINIEQQDFSSIADWIEKNVGVIDRE
jgi:hypothetical protein